MIQRIGLLLLFVPLSGLALALFAPTIPEAMAQSSERRDEGESGRGEGRGEGRGRGRGRFGGGDGESGRSRFGGGENGARGSGRRGGEGGGERSSRGENSDGERSQRPSGPPSSNSSDRPAGGASNLGMETYVRNVVKEHDKDGDMMLKGDEQKGLSSKAATADLNKDGAITTEELAKTLAGTGQTSAPPAAEAASGSEGSASDGSEDGDRGRRGDRRRGRERIGGEGEPSRGGPGSPTTATRVYTALAAGAKAGDKGAGGSTNEKTEAQRTYRFKRGADRLPATGLPSWFKSKDGNGDGQVAMSEYSRSWSDRTVGEFNRYDVDKDGVVTAKEATGK